MALDSGASSLRARPAKRSRLEADKRRDMLQTVENKFANIDFTKCQHLHAGTTGTAGAGIAKKIQKLIWATAISDKEIQFLHREICLCNRPASNLLLNAYST